MTSDIETRILGVTGLATTNCQTMDGELAALKADLVLARLLRRAVTELHGWCSYDDAETREFLEREKPK